MSKTADKWTNGPEKLEKVFTQMAKGKEISARDVKVAFAVILNDPAPTDKDIIDAMKAMIARLPAEEHFDVWDNASGHRFSGYEEEPNTINVFVAERALDSLEDLPRNKRSEAAYRLVWEDSPVPVGHSIQKQAVKKVLQYLPYAPEAYSVATATMDFTDDVKIRKALLSHAIKTIGVQEEDEEDFDNGPFGQAMECIFYAKDLKDEGLEKQARDKAVEFFHMVPEERQQEAKEKLLSTILDIGLMLEIADKIDATAEKSESIKVASLVRQIGGFSSGPQ